MRRLMPSTARTAPKLLCRSTSSRAGTGRPVRRARSGSAAGEVLMGSILPDGGRAHLVRPSRPAGDRCHGRARKGHRKNVRYATFISPDRVPMCPASGGRRPADGHGDGVADDDACAAAARDRPRSGYRADPGGPADRRCAGWAGPSTRGSRRSPSAPTGRCGRGQRVVAVRGDSGPAATTPSPSPAPSPQADPPTAFCRLGRVLQTPGVCRTPVSLQNADRGEGGVRRRGGGRPGSWRPCPGPLAPGSCRRGGGS